MVASRLTPDQKRAPSVSMRSKMRILVLFLLLPLWVLGLPVVWLWRALRRNLGRQDLPEVEPSSPPLRAPVAYAQNRHGRRAKASNLRRPRGQHTRKLLSSMKRGGHGG